MKPHLITKMLLLFLGVLMVQGLDARQPEGVEGESSESTSENTSINLREDCAQASRQVDLDINNVRSRLLNGGDVWWNLSDGRYIVPKVEPGSGQREVSSLFAGSVWLGGIDDQDNLRMACNTYRGANDNDFYPGPLDPGGETTVEQCENWDRFFRVTGEEIREHERNMFQFGDAYDESDIPEGVKYWPGQGNPFFAERFGFELPDYPQGLGSFKDFGPGRDEDNPNGIYNPLDGDFPAIEIRGCELDQFPDEMYFWIYNDAAGPHTTTQAEPIRMEVQVQAFSYATNDEINNMTFQRYKLINRAEQSLDSAYFAMWVDGDLGCDGDDYIGCDTSLSMMMLYNEDAIDGDVGSTCNCASNAPTYCEEVPILGVDYFRGPLGPKVFTEGGELRNPTIDETPDTIVELGMSSFTYYNREGGPGGWPAGMTDPQVDVEFYRYLSGSWRDGTRFTFGGSGYNPTGNDPTVDYAFPSWPDDPNGWSMCTAGLALGDRRTVQASGPFRLDPGAFNELIIGVVWVPDIQTYPCPDITPLVRADVKAQALFDACFVLPDGPDAPDLGIVELDRSVVFTFSNDTLSSNNAFLGYEERGLDIPAGQGIDTTYDFEGYAMYQLAGPQVDPQASGTLDDPNQARLVFQCDLKNNVSTIYNWEAQSDPFDPSAVIYNPVEMIDGNNEGISSTVLIEDDAFATGGGRLINNQRYFYHVFAYAYNNYDSFDYQTGVGQAEAFFKGRRNAKDVYQVIPRPTPYSELNSFYGDGPELVRLDGQGAGGEFLRVTEEDREAMLSEDFNGEITYAPRSGPVDVKIYNPYEVKDGEYLIEFFDEPMDGEEFDVSTGRFRVTNTESGESIESEVTLDKIHEQLIPDWGISVFARNLPEPGTTPTPESANGALGSEVTYEDVEATPWFGFWNENEVFNFVKTDNATEPDYELDPGQGFSDVINGPFYPFSLCAYEPTAENDLIFITPAWYNEFMKNVRASNPISNLNNVDIVLTPDRDKWSKCIVVETANREYRTRYGIMSGEHGTRNLDVRTFPSRGKEVDPATGEPVILDNEPTGYSYFPGYAVDVETGQRLNIFFGENSTYSEEILGGFDFPDSLFNGNDMIWNPNNAEFVETSEGFPALAYLGGQHTIYVTSQPYDGCESLRDDLTRNIPDVLHRGNKQRALSNVQWACLPVLPEDVELTSFADGLIPDRAVISMRVDNPYGIVDEEISTGANNGYPAYSFTIEGRESQPLESNVQIDSALDMINVVPNPYYGFSEYETGSFTSNVKITNLPPECTVTIYSLDGKFIRQYDRNEEFFVDIPGRSFLGVERRNFAPDITWDLTNARQIPISSGVYLIHVNAPGLGERVIKWFGVQRQFDPSGL